MKDLPCHPLFQSGRAMLSIIACRHDLLHSKYFHPLCLVASLESVLQDRMVAFFRPTNLAITSGFVLSGLFACTSNELQGVEAEVAKTDIKLDLPPVPTFTIPKTNPDGSYSVPQLRMQGTSFLDTDIVVRGKVLWMYDCAATVRTPEMSDADVADMLSKHPEKCHPPHFIIGENADTPTELGVQIVEYPRRLRKDELRNLSKDEKKSHRAALAAFPAVKVGDEVAVSGQWVLRSPKGFHNSDGLLTFASINNLEAKTEEHTKPESTAKTKKKKRKRNTKKRKRNTKKRKR